MKSRSQVVSAAQNLSVLWDLIPDGFRDCLFYVQNWICNMILKSQKHIDTERRV